jgi:uncharacterized membrane protein YcaP (DUF421 family)
MWQTIWERARELLDVGNDSSNIGALATALRAIIIYVFTLAIVRFGNKRFLSKATAFDVIVAIMLGSVMSRGIGGSSPLGTTLLAGAVLLGFHGLFAFVAYHTGWFGSFVKGERVLLIEDGEIQREGMREANITENDLKQAIRLNTNHSDPSKIKTAYLERDGSISVIPLKGEPRVVDVSVKDGVQTVRVELQ